MMVLLLALLLFACSRRGTAAIAESQAAGQSVQGSPNQASGIDNSASKACAEAARAVLGPSGEVAKCGHLLGLSSLEAVAFIRLERPGLDKSDLPVLRLVILRRTDSHWGVELDAKDLTEGGITNPSGYLEPQYIVDYLPPQPYHGFVASFDDHRSDDTRGFVLYLAELGPPGDTDMGSDIEIAWNPAVGRFQEFVYDQDPKGFIPELKNPKRVKSPPSPRPSPSPSPKQAP
jgi:hypothetical protein